MQTGEPKWFARLGFCTNDAGQAVAAGALARFAIRLFCRAAAFLWIRPFRAARSRSVVAIPRTSADAPSTLAFLRAVRSAERCARLRAWAARDFRIFFFAEAIFGTEDSNSENEHDSPFLSEPRKIGYQTCLSICAAVLAGGRAPLRFPFFPTARPGLDRNSASSRTGTV